MSVTERRWLQDVRLQDVRGPRGDDEGHSADFLLGGAADGVRHAQGGIPHSNRLNFWCNLSTLSLFNKRATAPLTCVDKGDDNFNLLDMYAEWSGPLEHACDWILAYLPNIQFIAWLFSNLPNIWLAQNTNKWGRIYSAEYLTEYSAVKKFGLTLDRSQIKIRFQ